MDRIRILGTTFCFVVFVLLPNSIDAGVEETREAYFNGSAYLRLFTPMPIWGQSAITFRTCRGGEILSQQYNSHTLLVAVNSEGLAINLKTPDTTVDVRIQSRLLDNRWHSIRFLYQLGTLNLILDKQVTILANSTYNYPLISDPDLRNEAAVLILGRSYSGCLLHGPGLIFNASAMNSQLVMFGPCPIALGQCTQHDILIRKPVDHCSDDPCLQHGVCISRPDSYECHCTARYNGKNCEFDLGAPCQTEPCKNGATCTEDSRGDYKCTCTARFVGAHCDTELIVHPLCNDNPCKNNGTCGVIDNKIKCDCLQGFIGKYCETDKNDCELDSCYNQGRCIDEIDGFKCNCTGTGYVGTLCQTNINECTFNGQCANGGVCYDTYGSYICECMPGFGGDNCEQQINECLSIPCQHGGTCIDHQNGAYECICPFGYSGSYCESVIRNTCPQDCPLNTDCIEGKCVCKPGSRCENSISMPLDDCGCLNGGTCDSITKTCNCPAGFDGTRCARLTPCSSINCEEPMICFGGKCICPENMNCATLCSSNPCMNGATCHNSGSDFFCQCRDGYNGTYCEADINECAITPGICGNGICINQLGSYKCYCEPGFTGLLCDMDVDECLSHPCKNNATCNNEKNDYTCDCPPGFNGKDCSVDIDECVSNPCFQGSTCINLIADFSCICMPGMSGRHCDKDIDECISAPCQHGGKCIDKLNGFYCNCTSTGFRGLFCEANIDECLSSPCKNAGICIDQINDYNCTCKPGFDGKNCEIDIDECELAPCQYGGTCLQRSNITLYAISEQYQLPKLFSQPFSFDNASGYECMCVNGITGKNCETNINECESNPCKHGTCQDQIGFYICDCDVGYEGVHCETEINECETYQPCLHGKCIDKIGYYLCKCDQLWGGKNCSVPLTGCTGSPCLNNGICSPSLVNETQHIFNCSCPTGYQGETCEKETTLSLLASSLLTVNTSRTEGYDINLRFRTTLPNGILVFGTGGFYSNYILELVNGRLNLHSSLLNKWEGVFIGSGLNNSIWHKVFVSINSSHLLLSANEETTIYPITSYDLISSNASYTTFPVTYLGGTIPGLRSYFSHLTHLPSSFVGCMQDVVINNQWIFPLDPNENQSLINVRSGCPRTPQCSPNPCHSNGQCNDLWHQFSCDCQRPHLGHMCQHNITAATFGHENTTHSAVIVRIDEAARRIVRSVFDISMFIRTRQPTGQVFYMGSDPKKAGDNSHSFVSAKLNGGELLVKLQFNGTPEEQPVGGNRLDNGYIHLLQVVRNLTLVQVKINGTEYFRKTLSSTGQLDADVLYLGGPPTYGEEIEKQITMEELDRIYFKGIIQDVQISNGSQAMRVELFPLKEPDLSLTAPFGIVELDETSILRGEVSDDSCRSNPCQHGAKCENTWNDFVCICPRGYKGKLCQDIQFCELHKCPGMAVCQNLEDGFDCITNTTFQGHEADRLVYRLDDHFNDVGKPIRNTIEISYRTKTGGTLLYAQVDNMFFGVAVYKEQVTVHWHLSTDTNSIQRFHNDNPLFQWQTIFIRLVNGQIEGGFKGWEDGIDQTPAFIHQFDEALFSKLFSEHSIIYLGGLPPNETNVVPKTMDAGAMYKGCLGETRIGGLLLPFFVHEEVYLDTFFNRQHFRLNSSSPEEGCVLCFQQDCKNGGICDSPSMSYACKCSAGYEEDDCSKNIDECLDAECTNNSTCIDLIANYTCKCQPGYEGNHCELEIDECLSQPCHNGGICTDLLASYSCECTEDYAGPQCDVLRLVTCENLPCRNGSTCLDGYNATTGNNFTCTCHQGLQGALCDIPFCLVEPCRNGGFCLTTDPIPVCKCSLGYMGMYCEIDIDECASDPCENNGLCIDRIGSFKCNCTGTGFEGRFCENDINECLNDLELCGLRGQCENRRGSFRCHCEYGQCGVGCFLDNPCSIENPCRHEGICIESCGYEADYTCNCTTEFTGKNCTRVAVLKAEGISPTDIAIIVVPVVIGILIIAGIFLGAFLMMARNKRATRGTYSPSAQEYCNPRLEMDNVLKPPPEERLI